MATNSNNKKNPNSELINLNISKLSTLQYIKVICIDTNKELHEIRTNVQIINDDIIQLYFTSKEDINITCPTGVALKLITMDAIYFAKAILNNIKNNKDLYIFVLDTPRKVIRQQNRKYYRINTNCPCVMLVNKQNNLQTYIAQSVNISKGGILLSNIESILTDEQINLTLTSGDCCHIVLFLEKNLKIKTYAKFIRSECVDGKYRYAFQFLNISKQYIAPFDKYLTNEEFKLLKTMKQK